MTAPKTRQKSFHKDLTGLKGEILPFKRSMTYRNGGRYYRDPNHFIRLGLDGETIVGEFSAYLSQPEIKQLLAWIDVNCTWHKTEIYPEPKKLILESDVVLPPFEIKSSHVVTKVHRRLTDQQRTDIARIDEAQAKRKAKEREEAKVAAAAKRAADKNRQTVLESQAEFGDLASALKVFQKHGLKIIVVEDKVRQKA